MYAPSRNSPATRTCVPSTATATTARTSPAKSQHSLPKSETGCLLAPKLRRAGEINPFVGQRRYSGGLGTALGEDAVDRALADLERGGNLGPGAPGSGKLDYLGRLGAGVRRLSLVLALGLGAGDPLALAFEHDLALELGHRRHDGEDHAAHRAGHAAVNAAWRFDRHRRVEDLERDAALAELLGEGQRIACRARQAVEPGHDELIARAQDAPAQQIELGPLAHARGLLGVDVALGAASGDQVADLGLQPGFLVAGGGAGVAEGRHALFLPKHL